MTGTIEAFLKVGIVASILLASSSVGYYYVVYLPRRDAQLDAERTLERARAAVEKRVDDYYLCQSPSLKLQLPLVVKYSGSAATEILFKYKHSDRLDSYQIRERNDIYYQADEVSPDVPEAFVSLIINRLSGELEITTRISREAVQFLADICDKRISGADCMDRASKIKAGGAFTFSCGDVAYQFGCEKWRSGENITGRYTYQCQRAERPF